MIRQIGISAKISSRAALDTAARTAADLRGRGFEVCFDYATADRLNDRGPCAANTDNRRHRTATATRAKPSRSGDRVTR